MPKNDGGEMYPRDSRLEWSDHVDSWLQRTAPGISRRDWLAGLAMQGLIERGVLSATGVSKLAYDFADAMIAQGDVD